MSTRRSIPATPRVISPSPTPSESQDGAGASQDGYFGPMTRSATRKRLSTPQIVEEDMGEDTDGSAGLRRARTRSRSPVEARRVGSGLSSTAAKSTRPSKAAQSSVPPAPLTNGKEVNGHLSLPAPVTPGGWSWRDLSRSPSPLGLIPIHRHWRYFVHKHEVPRKALHVSIGFVVIWLYASGVQTRAVCPYLMGALIPIAAVDILRHNIPDVNRLYVKVVGILMRESEFDGYNGVIFYLFGAWVALYCFPKDVGVVATLLLSWCDTAASTFGRLYGRYTPRIRRGKSLAGTSAAFLVGVATAVSWWGWVVPALGPFPGDEHFMFKGALSLPQAVAGGLGLEEGRASISGALALGVVGVWSGLVAASSEVVDLFGWDDNLTIPVLSAVGIWGFLKVFGA